MINIGKHKSVAFIIMLSVYTHYIQNTLYSGRNHLCLDAQQPRLCTFFDTSEQIASTFCEYFSSIYNLRDTNTCVATSENYSHSQLNDYIRYTALPSLTEERGKSFVTSFSLEEVKAVGFYKQFGDILNPILWNLHNDIKPDCQFTKQTQEAQITLIPKADKALTQCSSYRPISLIHVDLKVLTKLLTLRLQTVIPSLIGLDKVGFVPNRVVCDNILKTSFWFTMPGESRAHSVFYP